MLGQATSWPPGPRGAGGAAGPAPRHQPSESGKAIYIYCDYSIPCKHAASVVVKVLAVMHQIVGSSPTLCNIFSFCISCSWQSEIVHAMYVHGIYISLNMYVHAHTSIYYFSNSPEQPSWPYMQC